MDGFVPSLAYQDAASNVVEDISSVATSVLRSLFASDYFWSTEEEQNSFLPASNKNGAGWTYR